jgi:transposase
MQPIFYQWCKAYLEGSLVAVGANETVVTASELQETIRRIKQLEGALGRKTLENETLNETVNFAKAKEWIARSPVMPGDKQQELCAWRLAYPSATY